MKTIRSRTAFFSITLFLCLFSTYATKAISESSADYLLQTLYIFNFTKYVEWPMTSKKMKIGVVGNTSAEEQLTKMAKAKSSDDLEISVINTKNEMELAECQIVFIPSNNTAYAAELIESFSSKPILIVTEEGDFAKKGACVSFKVIAGKLRFQINEQVIRSKGLKVSSSLTALAEK
jgi:hypothetical protein